MFAKLYYQARNVLSRSPSHQEKPELRQADDHHNQDGPEADTRSTGSAEVIHPEEAQQEEIMVTTRAAARGDSTPNVATLKGKRTLGDEESSTPVKGVKRRKATASNTPKSSKSSFEESDKTESKSMSTSQESQATASDAPVADTNHLEPETPSAQLFRESQRETPRNKSPMVVIRKTIPLESEPAEPVQEATKEADAHTPGSIKSVSVYATPATTLKRAASPTPKAARSDGTASAQPAESASKRKKTGTQRISETKVVVEIPAVSEPSEQPSEEPLAEPAAAAETEVQSQSKFPLEIPSSTAENSTRESDNETTPVPAQKKKTRTMTDKAIVELKSTLPSEIVSSTAEDSTKPSNSEATPAQMKKSKAAMKGKNASGAERSTSKSPVQDETPKSASSTIDKKNSRVRFPSEEPSLTQPPAPAKQPTRIRFGSSEPVPPPAPVEEKPAEHEVISISSDDSSSDSDDEAPEAITTASAYAKTKAAEEEALRAHHAAEAKEKARRKERAERLAEEQRVKKEKERAERQARAREQEQNEDEDDDMHDHHDWDNDDENEDEEMRDVPATFSRGIDLSNLPTMLPSSLLAAAPSKRPPTPPSFLPTGPSKKDIQKAKLQKHIKFVEHGEKKIKDKKKGPVSVRVLGEENRFLAPKANLGGRNLREQWLRGRERERGVPVAVGKGKLGKKGKSGGVLGKMSRKERPRGFLRGKDE